MEILEAKPFQYDLPLLLHIALWRRYVNDVLHVWYDLAEFIPDFFNLLNSLYPSIELAAEISRETIKVSLIL